MLNKISNFIIDRTLPALGFIILSCVAKSIRLKPINDEFISDQVKKGKNVIFAFWHNRLIMMPHIYRTLINRNGKLAALISRSKDGQIVSGIIHRYGLATVRGSSSRGGKAAFKEMIRMLRSGYDAGYTPDGPKGPVYSVAQGIITLAQITGYPIVPISYEVTRRKVLRSWDRMVLPMPFTRGVVVYGKPVIVSRDDSERVKDEKAIELRNELLKIIDEGCASLGIEQEKY
ncbi:MAG: lysophospholipid acyltransferase family protein [Candidatus Ancaeobacter aquaticus]|nr:lysophospholipid acyltransferase family protein [Candidatus Ancaeobacter aquaticus]